MINDIHKVNEVFQKNKDNSHRKVYSNLINGVDEVINNILDIDVQHIDIRRINKEVQSELNNIKGGFVQKIEKLDQNAVWDRFTIAFFGETNAGKSTIIEALRLSMLEDEKLKENQLKEKLDLEISELNEKLEEVKTAIKKNKKEKKENLISQLERTQERAKGLENAFWANGLNTLRSWFGLLPISFFKKEICQIEAEISKLNLINPDKDDFVVELNAKEQKLRKKREQFLDGKIIGTGVQDFTQFCIEYRFNEEKEPFTLIDVPGIEGNEGKYETMIMDAVSKAHCVFYVCSAGKLPESGTIAKIKRYLNEQTEIYFLLNERKNTYSYEDIFTFEAMHPNAEKFRNDISTQMEKELGRFFKGCYSLQGLMAFCSKAEIPREERNYKFQKKLLNQFGTSDNLYSISQLEKVETLIRSQLEGMERKIIEANLQKAICAAIDFKEKILRIRNAKYSDNFVQIIQKEIKTAKDKNENNQKELESEFRQVSNRLSNSTIEILRRKLYHLIDNKANKHTLKFSDSKKLKFHSHLNEEEKMKFIAECYLKDVFENLRGKYNKESQKIITNFSTQVKENINKMANNIQKIKSVEFSNLENNTIGDFDNSFGFQWDKLSGMVTSVGSMAFTGASIGTSVIPGLGTALGALIGAVVGLLFVGLRWLLNKETPESKAKKQIDKTLASLKVEVKTKLVTSNKKIIDNCRKNIIEEVSTTLDTNLKGIRAIQDILDNKSNQLDILIKELRTDNN